MAEWQLYQQPGQGQAGGGMPPPPKPPRQNPYHDGVASSAQYYDLFEMIRRPNLAKENRPPDPPARSPKPLSKQKQIEKEIEQKFKAKRNRPAHQGKSTSARIIRLIFLALVLPPYIILYRLPKFLLVDWILFIARFIDNTLAAIGKAIQKAYERLKMRIRNSILSFWELIKVTFRKKMANQVDDDESLSFIAFIAAGLVALYRITLHPVIKISKKIWSLAKMSVKAIREFPGQLHRAIQENLKRLRTWRERLLQSIKNRLFQFKEDVLNRTTRPISRWIDAKIEACIALYRKGQLHLKQLGQALLFALRHPIQTSKLIVNALKTFSKRTYKGIADPINAWFYAKKESLIRIGKRVTAWYQSKIKSPLLSKWNQFKDIMNRCWFTPFKRYFGMIAARLQSWKSKIAASISIRLERPKRWLKQVATTVTKGYQFVAAHWVELYFNVKAALKKFLQPIYNFICALSEPFIWAWTEMWKELRPFFEPIRKLHQSLTNRIQALIYRIRRVIAWITVLSRYGMELVRGNTEKLFGNARD